MKIFFIKYYLWNILNFKFLNLNHQMTEYTLWKWAKKARAKSVRYSSSCFLEFVHVRLLARSCVSPVWSLLTKINGFNPENLLKPRSGIFKHLGFHVQFLGINWHLGTTCWYSMPDHFSFSYFVFMTFVTSLCPSSSYFFLSVLYFVIF